MGGVPRRARPHGPCVGERFCHWLCVWHFERRPCELQYPLVADLLLPYLVAGAVAGRSPCLRWIQQLRLRHLDAVEHAEPGLGFGRVDARSILKAAIVDDPNDLVAWWMLFDEYLSEAQWGAHHMDSDELVLPEEQCLRALDDADEIAAHAPSGSLADEDHEQLRELRRAFDRWRAWEEAGRPGRFYAWLEDRGGIPALWIPAHWPSA